MRVAETYNSLLVAVSIGIAIFASYAALTLLNRIPHNRKAWLPAGAVMLGAGMWTMHFIGMLSLDLDTPVHYDYSQTLLSLLSGVILAYGGLAFAASDPGSGRRLPAAGFLLGLAICVLHYSAMAAMRMPLRIEYDLPLAGLSVLSAAGLAYASLLLSFRNCGSLLRCGALLMGAAISGSHYLAMAATHFIQTGAADARSFHAHGLNQHHMALTVGTAACLIIAAIASLLLVSIRNEVFQARLKDQQYKSLFEQHPQAVYTLDLDGSCLGLNHAFEAITGYSASEMRSRPVTALAAPGDLAALAAQVRQAAGGVSQSGEIAWIHKRGHVVHSVSTHVPIQVRGRVVGIYGFIHDVTGLKQALEDRNAMALELKKSNDRLTRMQQIIGFGIWDHALQERTIDWSPEVFQMLGMDPQTPPTLEEFYSRIHPDDVARVKANIIKAKEGRPYRCEYRVIRDKEIRSILSQGEVLFDGHGRPYRMWGVMQDYTERKQTEAIIRKSDRLSIVSQMAAGVAHEIRNPLTSIKGFVQIMKPKINELHYRVMMSELERIEQIIREFLVIAKPSQQEQFQTVCLPSVLDDVISLLNTQAVMNNIWIVCETDPELPDIWCNANQLKQVFINIVKNAIEAMPGGGEIRIDAGWMSGSSSVRISIRDQGVGIPAERIKRLGEPYFTSKEKGTGLGLTICHRIIEAHGGSMSIQSELNKGTLVEISLPLGHTPAALASSG